MAFLNRYRKDQAPITTPAQSGGQSAFSSTTSPAQVGGVKGPTSSGRYTNLQGFLQANKGNDLGQRVADKITSEADQTQNKIGEAQKSFNTSADSSLSDARSGAKIAESISSSNTSKDLNTIIDDNNKLNQFSSARDAEYKGPSNLDETGGVKSSVQNVQSLASQAGTDGGRYNLLRTFFNRQGYNKGQKNLDNLFLQSDTNAQKALQGTQRTSNVLGNTYNTALGNAKQKITQLSEEAQGIRQGVKDVLSKTTEGVGKSVDKAYDYALNYAKGFNDPTNSSSGLIGLPELKNANVYDGIASNNYFGVDPSQYLRMLDPTRTNIVTKEQSAQIDALKKLAGNSDLTADAKKYITNLSGISDAGTYEQDRLQGVDSFKQAVSGAGAVAKSEINTTQDKINFETAKRDKSNQLLDRFNNLNIPQGNYLYDSDRQKMLDLGRAIIDLSNETGSNAGQYLPTAFSTTSGNYMKPSDVEFLKSAIQSLLTESTNALNLNNQALQNIYNKYGTSATGLAPLSTNKGVQ